MGGTNYLLGSDILGAAPKAAAITPLSPEQRAAEQVLADVQRGGVPAAGWPAGTPAPGSPPTKGTTGGWRDWLPLAAVGLVVIGAGGAWVIWKTKKARAK
jgi:hypothetical protein